MENDTPEEKPEKQPKEHPDRPLECSECKKPITVYYTECVGNTFIRTGMCEECPQLQKRLRGTVPEEKFFIGAEGSAGLACGECGTTLENVRVSRILGCSHCYHVFGDYLMEQLLAANKISPTITKKKKTVPLHVGRSPGEAQEISPTLRLIALNEALEETLKREDYEQAAWLRDQIKALTEESKKENGKKK